MRLRGDKARLDGQQSAMQSVIHNDNLMISVLLATSCGCEGHYFSDTCERILQWMERLQQFYDVLWLSKQLPFNRKSLLRRDHGQVLHSQLLMRFGVKLRFSVRAVVGSASE